MKGGIILKEYGIYIRNGSGTPYMIHIYNNIYSAKSKLYEMIELDEERHRPYFVDNDFFSNKYNTASKLKYYCIKCREVSDWKTFSETDITKDNDKIIFLNNFKKSLTY